MSDETIVTDPHHVCEAMVVLERWVTAARALDQCSEAGPTANSLADVLDAVQAEAHAYIERRREAQGETT